MPKFDPLEKMRFFRALERLEMAIDRHRGVLERFSDDPPQPGFTSTRAILSAIHHEGDRIMGNLDDLSAAVATLQAQDTAIQGAIAAENAAVEQLINDYKAVIGSSNLSPDDQAKLDTALANVQQASTDLTNAAASASSTTTDVETADPGTVPPAPAPAPEVAPVDASPSTASDQSSQAAPSDGTSDAASSTSPAASPDTTDVASASTTSDEQPSSGDAASTPAVDDWSDGAPAPNAITDTPPADGFPTDGTGDAPATS